MSKETIYKIAVVLLLFVLVLLVIRACRSNTNTPEPLVIHDTIVRTDTMIESRTKLLYRTKFDTIVVVENKYDSSCLNEKDSITISIPIDYKEYLDSIVDDSTRIQWCVRYEGYKAKIDSFGIDYRFERTPVTIDKRKGFRQFVGIGIGAGYGIGIVNGNVVPAPEIGVHIVYGFGWTWKSK